MNLQLTGKISLEYDFSSNIAFIIWPLNAFRMTQEGYQTQVSSLQSEHSNNSALCQQRI